MKYSIKKPGAKSLFMILIAIILVTAAFLFAEYRNREATIVYNKSNNISVGSSTENTNNLESNTDWKKILLAGDTSSTTSKTKDLTKKVEKLEPIDAVSREFFAQYMELRQLGASGDKLSQQELVEKTINNMNFMEPKTYKINEILVKSDNSDTSIKKYGNEISAVFKKYSIDSRNEGMIVKDYQQNGDPNTLKELDPIIQSYKNIVNGLIKIVAPQNLASLHTDVLNSMNGALFIAEALKKSPKDPISGLQAISKYEAVSQNLFNALLSIKKFIKSKNISYSANEDGYLLIK